MTLAELKRRYTLRILAKHQGNKPRAAKELGISLKTLYNMLNRWEIENAENKTRSSDVVP